MSGLADGVFYVAPEQDRECQFCRLVRQCRPYGPGNEDICYECAQKPAYKAAVERRMKALMKQAAYVVAPPGYSRRKQ